MNTSKLAALALCFAFLVRWAEPTYGPVDVATLGRTFQQDQWTTRPREKSFPLRDEAIAFKESAEANGMINVKVFRVTEEEIELYRSRVIGNDPTPYEVAP